MAQRVNAGIRPVLLILGLLLVLLPAQVHAFGAGSMFCPSVPMPLTRRALCPNLARHRVDFHR